MSKKWRDRAWPAFRVAYIAAAERRESDAECWFQGMKAALAVT